MSGTYFTVLGKPCECGAWWDTFCEVTGQYENRELWGLGPRNAQRTHIPFSYSVSLLKEKRCEWLVKTVRRHHAMIIGIT